MAPTDEHLAQLATHIRLSRELLSEQTRDEFSKTPHTAAYWQGRLTAELEALTAAASAVAE